MSYSIAQAAERSGLSVDTLRYYERIGLLEPPARDSGGRRAYSDEDLVWLSFLTKLRTTEMPLAKMREYAKLRDLGQAGVSRRKQILLDQRSTVLSRIAELEACVGVLDYKIDNYERCERDLSDRMSGGTKAFAEEAAS